MATSFYNIPRVSGAPFNILRNPLISQIIPALLTGDAIGIITALLAPPWGLFKNGSRVIAADSVIGVEFKREWDISTYPIESGGFESYNKVATPFEFHLQMTRGGSEFDREQFLRSIEIIAGNLELYDAITPERTYNNVNIRSYSYRRTATNGVGLLTVDLLCVEVRQALGVEFSNTKSPSSAGRINGGTSQPTSLSLPAALVGRVG